MLVENNTFIVTGGASGLGEQVIRTLVAQRGRAIIIDINADRAQNLVKELGADNVYFPGSVDVTHKEQVQEVFKDIKSVYPDWPIVGAILCSGVVFPPENLKGYGPNGQLTSFEQFKHIVNVNLLGTYCVAQKVAEILLDNKPLDNDDGERGVIIATSSILGLDGSLLAYGSSKAGVAGLTLPMARELAGFGIRVVSIAPGPFETPLVKNAPMEAPPCLFPKRHGRASEFADLVLQIISNRMLNGTVIRLDGALRG